MHALFRRFALLMFINYATQGAFIPLFSLRLQELGFDPVQIGWSCAAQALASLVGPLAAGQVADRYFPARRCLSACALVAGILFWVLSDLSSPLAVFFTVLAIWLVLGPANTLCVTLCFAHLPHPEKSYGPVRLWGTAGWVAAGWLVGVWFWSKDWLVENGWASSAGDLGDIFRWAAVLAFLLSAYGLTLPHTPARQSAGHWLAPLAAWRQLGGRAFRVFWACSFGICVSLPFVIQLLPLFLEHLGLPRPWLSPILTLSQSIEMLSLALLPMILLRLGLRGTMLLGLLAWAAYLALLTLGHPNWLVIASLSLNGLCISCYIVAGQVFINSRAQGDVRASAQALLVFVNGLGMVTGNLLVGWLRQELEGAFLPTFAIGTVITLALAMLFFIGFKGERLS